MRVRVTGRPLDPLIGSPRTQNRKLTVSMSKHRCSLSMSNSPGVIGGSGDGQERGVVLASDLEESDKERAMGLEQTG